MALTSRYWRSVPRGGKVFWTSYWGGVGFGAWWSIDSDFFGTFGEWVHRLVELFWLISWIRGGQLVAGVEGAYDSVPSRGRHQSWQAEQSAASIAITDKTACGRVHARSM